LTSAASTVRGLAAKILADDILSAVVAADRGDGPTEVGHPPGVTSSDTIGRLMAERTTVSWTTVPHFFVTREIDAGALNGARDQVRQDLERLRGIRVTHTDLLVAIVARTIRKHPRLNASWVADHVVAHEDVNIALAIGVDKRGRDGGHSTGRPHRCRRHRGAATGR
jgi:pyruvate dehydrogenase E2 component (dihydrolipoamide acetyltransferase)